jgi:hypothetical protein
MIPAVVELSASALFAAGLAASPHCALMCGALNAAQMRARGDLPWREAQLILQCGRVTGYAVLGAVAGGLGGTLLAALPQPGVGRFVQASAALLLILAGLLQLKGVSASPRTCCTKPDLRFAAWPLRPRLFLQGLIWAALPCGILYGVLLLASFAGTAASGALLMTAFGLGTLPLLWASGGMVQALTRTHGRRALQYGSGVALLLLGLASATAALMQSAGFFAWCVAHA